MKMGITGATSGLGKRLIEMLVTKGYFVRALVRETSDIKVLNNSGIELIVGDIIDIDSLPSFIKGIDVCFHIAAQVKYTSKSIYYKVNFNGTLNLCKTIIAHNSNCRFIYCSTISSLRVLPYFRIKSSIYALSKYDAEQLVIKYMKEKFLKATIIYPGQILSKYDRNLIPVIIDFLKNDRSSFLLREGFERGLPAILVDDLCELFIKAATNDIAIGKRYISVEGLEIGMNDLVKMIIEKFHLRYPKKIFFKAPLFIYAKFIEFIFKLFKLGTPPIYGSIVNNLSLNIKNFRKKYDDPYVDLGWKQEISKDTLIIEIKKILDKIELLS